mgnify:CR=1 FL=1
MAGEPRRTKEIAVKKIIHIDADCFFAAIEMRDDPSLVNRPFAVGGSAEGRGVLTTCNYPAREYGVRSAMPTAQAYRLCPELLVVPVNITKYRGVSAQMLDIFERFTDLIEPLSAISGSTDLEVRETKHLYIRQSAMRQHLDEWIDKQSDWPILTTSIAKKWLHDGDGLRDRGITRDLDWGIPVRRGDAEWPGMEGKVFYVWFDAPIEYIACADEWAKANGLDDAAWQRWWRTDMGADDVRYTQFMGKDNVPFHTLSFPATILGSGEPWKMVDHLKSFNYLNYDGGQFSTSQGRGIFMDQALELLPADYWRWWLLSHAPESSDSEFTWENFQTSVNKDLADVLGNFVSRITKFCRSKFGEAVPDGGSWGPAEHQLIEELAARVAKYEALMETMEVRKSAQELRAIWVAGNEYLQSVAPWTTLKTDPAQAAAQTRLGLNLVRLYAVLSAPFIPGAAANMLTGMHASDATWPEDMMQYLNALAPGHAFTTPPVLFAKITDEERDSWQTRFAGTRS